MEDLNILQDNDLQTIDINLDTNNNDTSGGLGIELLVDKNKYKTDDNTSPKKENTEFKEIDEINLFNDAAPNSSNDINIEKTVTLDNNITNDPILKNENTTKIDNEYKPIHSMSAQDIKNEKIDLIYKFKKLENQGIRTTMNYNMNSQLDDMRNEYIKLKKQRETENSVKFQRKMLMACITGIEFLNGKFDPFSVKLDGWSESMNENINDYDEIFEELHEKYRGNGEKMAPELRLLFMIGGSGFMFHLTNTMFKSSLPGMDDILKQNPELMQQFANAAVNTNKKEEPKASNSGMGGMGGMMSGLMGNMFGGGGGSNNSMNNQPKKQVQPEMDGAENLDNILDNMNINTDIDIDNISIMSNDTINADGSISLNI